MVKQLYWWATLFIVVRLKFYGIYFLMLYDSVVNCILCVCVLIGFFGCEEENGCCLEHFIEWHFQHCGLG